MKHRLEFLACRFRDGVTDPPYLLGGHQQLHSLLVLGVCDEEVGASSQ